MSNTDHHREKFLTAMRNVANSVTIVTTDGPAGKSGATVSSFCSVSADPPTVLVCLNTESRTADFVEQNARFAVNVLPENTHALAEIFAGLTEIHEDDRFEHGDWYSDASNMPLLNNATGFSCKVIEKVTSSSHHIFIGQIVGLTVGTDNPLLYMNQRFLKIT